MNYPPSPVPHGDLKRQREEIRRGLFRVNTALLAIVAVVVGLALAAILAAYRASQRTLEATAATQAARDQLWQSYLAQATAGRLSTTPGRKSQGRRIIEAAARIRPALELRNESIAHMALLDLAADHQEVYPENTSTYAWSADLSRYALVDLGGTIRIHRLPDHQKLMEWRAPTAALAMLLFSPGGRYLLVGYRAGGFQVLDVQTASVSPLGPHLLAADFTSDGEILGILVDPKTVQFLQSASGRAAHAPLSLGEPAKDLGFDLGGHKLALNCGRSIQVWDWVRGEKLVRLEHERSISCMAWSAQQLAIGDEFGGVRVWDSESFAPLTWVAHKSLVDTVLFNHHGDLLVSDSWDGSCKIWNPRTGHLLLTTTSGFGLGFSGDDSRLGYAIRTSARERWGWWQLAMPQGLWTIDCRGSREHNIFHVDFSPDGQALSVLENDEVRVLDLVSGQWRSIASVRNGRSAHFLSDGRSLLVCANNRIAIAAGETADARGSAHRETVREVASIKAGHLDGACLSRDRRLVTFLANDSDIALLDLQAPDHPLLFTGADKPAMPALSPDRKWLVSGTFHGRGSVLWDAATGRKLRELDPGNSNPFFSPDSSLLVCAGDKEYRVYDTRSWTLQYSVPTGSAIDLPNYAAFSGDGRLLAIVKELQIIHLIEPRSGAFLASLVPPEPQIITSLSFNPDGGLLAAATTAGVVQLWDLSTIHHDLAAIGLDWNSGSGAGPAAGSALSTNHAVLSVASARFVGPALASVALVVFCAWFVLRRQRQLFGSYLRIDDLMEQRNRELKVAHTELMHSQKMKALGTLAAGIAHDFNNLLSVIRMSNKLIGRETKGNADIEENVGEVERAVQQGKHIVASMLGFSNDRKAESGAGLFLPDLVEDTVGLLSRQFLSGITLDLELDRESPAVNLPRARLEQILLNLIVNAAEAMEGKGHLRIQVRRQPVGPCQLRAPRAAPGYLELVVADTGCGISPEILPHIFDPFFTTKAGANARGTGLGLSMIYAMAEQDGLGIGLESSPGQGATFRIVIPVDGPPAAPRASAAPEMPEANVRDWHTGQGPGAG